MAIFESIFRALDSSGCRYVVVGGVATVLHGHARLTADVDLIVDLAPDAARALVDALVAGGFRPRAPVSAQAFADPAARDDWVRNKGMRVFSFWDPKNPMREVDLFIENPIPFEDLWLRAVEIDLGGFSVRVASIDDLISGPVGSWVEARDFRIELTLRATAAQRLEWLEEAILLAHRTGALPRPR